MLFIQGRWEVSALSIVITVFCYCLLVRVERILNLTYSRIQIMVVFKELMKTCTKSISWRSHLICLAVYLNETFCLCLGIRLESHVLEGIGTRYWHVLFSTKTKASQCAEYFSSKCIFILFITWRSLSVSCLNTILYYLFPIIFFLSMVMTIYSDAASASGHILMSPPLQSQCLACVYVAYFCLSVLPMLWK